jgi:hypothetical protein
VGLAVGVTGAAETGVELTGADVAGALEDGDDVARFAGLWCFFVAVAWCLAAGLCLWWAAAA